MPVALAPRITSSTSFYDPSSYYYSSTMLSGDDENWATIEDKNVRRRIQNRHSQRKRRKKLKEQRLSTDSTSSSSFSQESYQPRDASAQQPICIRSLSEYSGTSRAPASTSSLEQEYQMSEDIHLRPHRGRSMSETSNSTTSSFPIDSRTHHHPISTHELDGVDWTALNMLDDKVITSVIPDDRFMDFNCLENQNEIFNAQIQMALGLDSLVKTQDMDHLSSTNPLTNSVHDNYLLPKAVGCFSATTQLSKLPPVSSSMVCEATSGGAGHGSTALHLAAQQGHVQIAQLLLDTAADVNAINSDGESTLHLAVAAKNHAMVSLLLKYGADHNARNARQESALHLAVETNDLGIVGLLLTRAVDMELQDGSGQTAFHRAAAKGFEDVMLLLMCKGADSAANVGSAR